MFEPAIFVNSNILKFIVYFYLKTKFQNINYTQPIFNRKSFFGENVLKV